MCCQEYFVDINGPVLTRLHLLVFVGVTCRSLLAFGACFLSCFQTSLCRPYPRILLQSKYARRWVALGVLRFLPSLWGFNEYLLLLVGHTKQLEVQIDVAIAVPGVVCWFMPRESNKMTRKKWSALTEWLWHPLWDGPRHFGQRKKANVRSHGWRCTNKTLAIFNWVLS